MTAPEPGAVVEVRHARSSLIEVHGPAARLVDVKTSFVPGPPGPQGEAGETGPVGPQGAPAPTFEQHFAVPQQEWVIHHNLNAYPVVVTTFDLNGEAISGSVSQPDRNTVIVTWAFPFAGTARLVG